MRARAGFTLTEIMVVAVIVGVLAAAALPTYGYYVRRSRIESAQSVVQMVGAAVVQAHLQGIDIGDDDWAAIGVTDPGDRIWVYSFDEIDADDEMPNGYAIEASGRENGPMEGVSGQFRPMRAFPNKFGGVFN